MLNENRVTFFKYLLPIISFCLLIIVFVWPDKLATSTPSPHLILLESKLEYNQAKELCFASVDSKKRPFFIKSRTGKYLTTKDILLTNLEITLHLNNGEEITLKGDQGIYDHRGKKMNIDGNVRITHSNGTYFDTANAVIDLERGTAQNHTTIRGGGKNSRIEAKGFKILEQGQQIVFLGQPEITTYR